MPLKLENESKSSRALIGCQYTVMHCLDRITHQLMPTDNLFTR